MTIVMITMTMPMTLMTAAMMMMVLMIDHDSSRTYVAHKAETSFPFLLVSCNLLNLIPYLPCCFHFSVNKTQLLLFSSVSGCQLHFLLPLSSVHLSAVVVMLPRSLLTCPSHKFPSPLFNYYVTCPLLESLLYDHLRPADPVDLSQTLWGGGGGDFIIKLTGVIVYLLGVKIRGLVPLGC